MVSQSEYYLNETLPIIINRDIKFMSGQINIDVKKNLYSMNFVTVIQNQRYKFGESFDKENEDARRACTEC